MTKRGRPPYPDVLTPREWEVLDLLRERLTNDEIASRLDISLATAKFHVSEIIAKLGVRDRREAAAWQQQGEEDGTRRWLAGLAPLLWVKRLPFAWLPKAAASAVLTATAAGIAMVAWSARPNSTVATTPNGCSIEQTLAGAPTCAPAAPRQAPPGPSSGTKLAGGLLSPGGMKMSPDGMLYVAEAGTGGSSTVTTPAVYGGTTGLTGRISKIDPASGARTTVIDSLPNFSFMGWDANGPADVAFLGTQLYYLHTFGGAAFGLPGTPTGIYKVANGTATLVADFDAFNKADPPPTLELGGSGNSMTVQDGAFYVVDSLAHSALKVTAAGVISRIADVASIEPTRITLSGRGPFYVNSVAPLPHAPELAGVYSFPYPTGNLVVADNDLNPTNVEVSPGGQYVQALSIGGSVLESQATGVMSLVVDGFPDAGGLIFVGDTAYFLNGTGDATGDVVRSDGQVWKITGFSSVTPHAPPNAGTGSAGGSSNATLRALALAAAVLGIGAVGGAVATRRR